MKYILVLCFISLVSIGKGQVPPHGGMPYPDPMQPIVKDTLFPSMRRSYDSVYQINGQTVMYIGENEVIFPLLRILQTTSARCDSLQHRIDSIERRPIIYIDTMYQQLWVKCPDGSCDIFIRKL